MIETISLILFIAAVIFVALGPKSSNKNKNENENENDSDTKNK